MNLLYNIIKYAVLAFAFAKAENPFDESEIFYKGYNADYELERTIPNITFGISPPSWDWRDHGVVVGPIKNQGQCGSCWAFSAIGALESQIRMKTNNSVSLSEQDMVDCVKNVKSPDKSMSCCDGCGGGEMYSVYQYLKNTMDSSETQYPYFGSDQKCKSFQSSVKQKLKSYVSLPKGDEELMVKVLHSIGPLSIGVNANSDWQQYTKGVYDPTEEQCESSIASQDHGVILVGYGTEKDIDYWVVRNSWGKEWGEDGYIRISRGKNACGISNSVIYPVLEK
jgi:cathepsin L